jgi:hypothetical protein
LEGGQMRLKSKYYNNRSHEVLTTKDLVDVCRPSDSDPWTCALIARMIDTMNLTDQQKLDLIDPHSEWEIEK